MSNILEWMNTVSKEVLINDYQVIEEIAEKIRNNRPFLSEQEIIEKGGISKDEYTRVLNEWRALEENEAEPTDFGSDASKESHTVFIPSKPRARKWVTRIVFALLIIAALGAIAYFGVPLFIERILNPLETNTSRVSEIAADQKEDVARLEAEITSLRERATALETRAQGFDDLLAAHNITLQKLETMQASLQTGLDEHKTDIIKQVNEQLTLTRAIELLSRSRLYLTQNNYGMAREDAASAHALLTSLLSTVSSEQDTALRTVIKRLEMALDNLPAYPVVAVYDIDYAWQLLVDGLPNVPAVAVTPVVTETMSGPDLTPSPEPTTEPGS